MTKSQNTINQGFSYFFLLHVGRIRIQIQTRTNIDGSRLRRPTNLRMLRIRIHNTAQKYDPDPDPYSARQIPVRRYGSTVSVVAFLSESNHPKLIITYLLMSSL